jgi:hypothetical protein
MNGIQSLMQGAPTSPQPTQAPAMPAQNNPQMAAAMDVVDNDLDKLNLDPRTKALLKTQEAYDLIQSAQNELAMSQPQNDPPTIEGQRQMQTMDGIAGILQSLNAGMQQRGRQVQQSQARQMMGGLPTQPAPNMRFAASGGLIGYQNGGDIMGPPEPNLYQRMGQGLKNYGANAQESMDILRAAKAGIGVPYENRSAAIQQVRDQITAEKQNRDPNFIQRMGQKLMDAGLNVEESKSILKKFYNTFGKTYEEMSNGMAMGGIVGYAGPDGSEVKYDYMSDPNLYAPTQVEEPDEDILKFARERMGRDPEAEALAAGERLRELTGAEDLMKRREEATAKLEAQRASRFSPEMERKRLIRQGLAGLAEKGLGGFGSGYTAEEERIAGEKLSAAEASVADMDKLIGELRELGMSQFEAEKQARNMVEEGIDNGMTAAQAVLASRRQAETALMQSETTRRGQDIQAETSRAVADIQTSGSEFKTSLGIRIKDLRRNNPDLSQTEIESRALNSLVDDELRVGLARLGVSRDDQNRKEINDSITAATEMFSKNFANMTLSPEEMQTQIFELAKKIRDDLYGSAAPTGNGSTYAPMPTDRSQLVPGTIYATPRGNARWNGTAFETV